MYSCWSPAETTTKNIYTIRNELLYIARVRKNTRSLLAALCSVQVYIQIYIIKCRDPYRNAKLATRVRLHCFEFSRSQAATNDANNISATRAASDKLFMSPADVYIYVVSALGIRDRIKNRAHSPHPHVRMMMRNAREIKARGIETC